MSLRKVFKVGALGCALGMTLVFIRLTAAQDAIGNRQNGADGLTPFSDFELYGAADNDLLSPIQPATPAAKPVPSHETETTYSRSAEAAAAASRIVYVHEAGDPKRIEFRGLSLFSEAELQFALALDLKFQAAARPSAETAHLLAVLERRLKDGFQHSGCPDASVVATFDAKRSRIVVQINEGPQFRHGTVEVVGTDHTDKQEIVRWLTTEQTTPDWRYFLNERPLDVCASKTRLQAQGRYGENTPPMNGGPVNGLDALKDPETVTFWEAGKVVDFGHFDDARLNSGIQLALLQLGWATRDFKTELTRDVDAGTVNLRITVSDAPPKLHIGEIVVAGLQRDSRDSLLSYLGISRGDALTAKTLESIRDKLSSSCRYWGCQLSVHLQEGSSQAIIDGKAELRLHLEEYAPAPPLGEPLANHQETMRRCAAWLQSLNSNFGEQDLICSTEAIALGGGLQQAQIALSADGTMAVNGVLQSTIGVRADHTVLVSPGRLELYDWKGKSRFARPLSTVPQLRVKIRCHHDATGNQSSLANLAYVWSSKKAKPEHPRLPYVSFQIDPVALVRFVDLPDVKATSDAGIMSFENAQCVMQIDETTGAIQSVQSASFLSAGVSAIDLKSQTGFVTALAEKSRRKAREFPNSHDPADPCGSAVAFLLAQFEKQPAIQQVPSLVSACRHAQLIVRNPVVRSRIAQAAGPSLNGNSDSFRIPGNIQNSTATNWSGVCAFYLPVAADELFPRGTWPWMVCRESAFAMFQNGGADENPQEYERLSSHELMRLLQDSGYGPATAIAFAKIYRHFRGSGADRLVSLLVAKANSDLSDEAFLKDVYLLTRGDHGLAVACRAIAEQCGSFSDEETEELQIYMPAEAHEALKQLVARRKAKPQEPPAGAIEAVLLEWWHNGLQDIIERELRAMSSSVARVPSAAENAR